MIKKLSMLGVGLLGLGAVSGAQASLLINGGFDDPITGLNSGQWNVYPTINGWTAGPGTAGIEVHYNALTGVLADTPYQYVELDSDWKNATLNSQNPTNSSMYQVVHLDVGLYALDWMYRARTNGTDNDNGIIAYLTTDVGGSNYYEIGKKSETVATQAVKPWEPVGWEFTIGVEDEYFLWFAAWGNDNTLGGFVDSVSLNEVPEPTTMLLFGVGLAGLAGLRRRK